MTAADGTKINITSTWTISRDDSLGCDLLDLAKIETVNEEKNLENHGNSDDSTNLEIVDLVDLTKFLILEQSRETPEPNTIKVTTHSPILRFSIVMDVAKIEIFTGAGSLCSYWKTVDGTNVEEFAELDTKIYRYDIDLPPLITYLEVKLYSKMSSVMIVGLKARIMGGESLMRSRFNFQNVESMLSGSSLPLSGGAQRALQFMKNTENSPFSMPARNESIPQLPSFGSGPPPSMEQFMSLFSSQLTLGSTSLNESKDAPVSQLPSTIGEQKSSKLSSELKDVQREQDFTGVLDPNIKTYLDVRLQEMEERLKLYFDSSLQAAVSTQNQKLDLILSSLNK